MSSARVNHTASAISGGRVFVSGGYGSVDGTTNLAYLPTNEIYDPELNQWQTVDGLLQGRAEHTAVVLNNGTVMIAGGFNNADPLWTCRTGGTLTDDECWYITQLLLGDDVGSRQDVGTHGYVDGAEFFDQNGGRVVLSGTGAVGVAPYRIRGHSSFLSPDGKHHMHGGQGNIVPTYFKTTANLAMGSYLTTAYPTTNNSGVAAITGGNITALINTPLARKISARLVDGDIFFSPPRPPAHSIKIGEMNVDLGYTTAPVDGLGVGKVLGANAVPGLFRSDVTLDDVGDAFNGYVNFPPVTSGADDATISAGSLSFFPASLPLGTRGTLVGPFSSITMPLTIRVPAIYENGIISGQVTLTRGTIDKINSTPALPYEWKLEISSCALVNFQTGAAVLDPADNSMAIATDNSVQFTGVAGKITNSSNTLTAANVNSGLAGLLATGLETTLYLTSSRIDLFNPEQPIPFNFDTSTIVIREMISADDLAYVPDGNAWEFGIPAVPVFRQSSVITPASDITMIGGRNCEADPPNDCDRSAPTFTARDTETTYVSKNLTAWPELGKLNTKRAFHTGTLLPDGRILACGGSDGVNTLASCELRDPVTKKWTYTGSMNSPRTRHTATLLPNGNVLLAGGAINSSTYAINTAEIYYPASGRCVNTGSMNAVTGKRANHTATLLPDGNVLVAGGNTVSNTGNAYSETSEIYFTTMAAWVPPIHPTMSAHRAQHTATLLKNGTVVLAGGIDGGGALRTTDIYNFASQSWTAGDDLVKKRYAHTATLLRDGRVFIAGGLDNQISQNTTELSNTSGGGWSVISNISGPMPLNSNRSNHRATLLPNGKVMLTGGEVPGSLQGVSESFDPDYPSFTEQGLMTSRSNHAAVLSSSGEVVAIGGWNGSSYLDSTEELYFSYSPDYKGFVPKDLRNPQITTGPELLSRTSSATLLSGTSNFHGYSEASGGGSGSANSSYHNPRVYLSEIDNPSGFLTDITNNIYRDANTNPGWERTLSSITVVMPSTVNSLPYGYYHMRVAANGQFSNGHVVQVAMDRPTGAPNKPKPPCGLGDPRCDAAAYDPYWRGTSSIAWNWTWGPAPHGEVNGYNIYSASGTVFVGTVAYTISAAYTQSDLAPNTPSSILVSYYNMGGRGALSASSTFYTLAAPPTNLAVTKSEFNSATLEWSANGNLPHTAYQVTMSTDPVGFTVSASTKIAFSNNHTSTTAYISNLQPSVKYSFRVQAQNGSFYPAFYEGYGEEKTAFSNMVSTIAVGSVTGLSGVAMSSVAISWTWNAKQDTDIIFEVYDVSTDTPTPVLPSSITASLGLLQPLLTPNTPYKVRVNAAFDGPYGILRGPPAYSPVRYTFADNPTADPYIPLEPGTGTVTANWQPEGNPSSTTYIAELAIDPYFLYCATLTVTGSSATFTGLTPNTLYYGRVRAINGDGIMTYPPVDLGARYTRPNKPENIVAVKSLSGVSLTWDTANNPAGTRYQVILTTQSSFDIGFSTYKAYSDNFTDNKISINGLLTYTDYLFAIEARNGDSPPLYSGRADVPLLLTLAGPGGAPTGSISGTSDPSKEVTIEGVLPNGRKVTMYVPAGAFPAATGLAVSSYPLLSGPCTIPPGGVTLPLVGMRLYSENGAQPQVPLTLRFDFTASEKTLGIGTYASQIVLARYNSIASGGTGDCLPLETSIDVGNRLVTATLNHFSDFQLIVKPAVGDLKSMRVYPNPFYTNRGNGYVTIEPVPANTKIRIYTLSGEKIWEGSGGTPGVIIWKGVNKSGHQVASGIYLGVLDSTAGKKVIKIAVER